MKLNKTSSAFTLIELLVVIAIIAILASIALPVFSSVQERGRQTKDMSNGKQIALGLKQFAVDHNGSFPNKLPGDVTSTNYDAGALPLATGAKSNDAFWWLFPNYLSAEDIFSTPATGWCPSPPDNTMDAATDIARVDTLKAGECGYYYVTALVDTANPQFPLLGDAGAAEGVQEYTNVQTDKGGVWKGKKAVVIFVDGSGQVMTCNNQATPTATFVTRPGQAYNITDNTATDWLATANLVLVPQ
jgi:prepilin-type N-terminal cleavage/methylation domain-containing protein